MSTPKSSRVAFAQGQGSCANLPMSFESKDNRPDEVDKLLNRAFGVLDSVVLGAWH